MTKKIFRSICLVAMVVFAASLVLIMGVLYQYYAAAQVRQLRIETTLAANGVETGGLTYLENLDVGDCRLTWIASDGSVKFDNKASSSTMENHLERAEVQQALKEGVGESSRYSTTLTERQFYSARKLSDGSVIRLAESQLTWWSLTISMLQPILVVLLLAVGLSLYLASRLSKKIVQPLNELNLDDPDPRSVYEELAPLVTRLGSQQLQLKAQAAELAHRRDEFDAATRPMSEGILLLNDQGVILSINDAATRLLHISRYCVGKDLLLFNNSLSLQELLHAAGNGEHCQRIIQLGEADYQFSASPVLSNGKVSGIALMIFDITEREKAEQMRREFTANVSHELKTPLQSIYGSAELLTDGMVKEEDVPRFAGRILSESKRMIALVEDIIKLSRLDEGARDLPREETDLYTLARQTVQELTPVAQAADVTLELTGGPAALYGVPQLLSGIVFNLCDNAIKYNVPGGRVSVRVEDQETSIRLTVQDTGIGIPPDQQDRIFERFYRVDKSRSKEVGGTGLGLSIVKHAAKLHQATVDLHSVPDEGTTVIVTFPKKQEEEYI